MQSTSQNISNVLKYGKYYTGVGARKTPRKILFLMEDVAKKLSSDLFILRSGGAEGADNAFEIGAGYKSIFYASDATDNAMEVAKMFHPSWNSMKDYSRKLHARNAFQVLGFNLKSPSEFVICWTPDGAINHSERSRKTGGTGTAISIASYHGIPVYNLKRQDHLERVMQWIG